MGPTALFDTIYGSHYIGQNMEVYVDNMLMKSRKAELHLDDLRETFDMLRKYQMKLNPQSACLESRQASS